jgi:uncharacterized protein
MSSSQRTKSRKSISPKPPEWGFFILLRILFRVVASTTAVHLHYKGIQMDRTITVSGHAEVKKAPELAILSLNVQSQAKTTKGAQKAQAVFIRLVLGTLGALGIPDMAIKTQRFDVRQAYKPDEKTRQNVPDGYVASQQLVVTVDADEAGETIEAIATHQIQVQVSFGLKDHDAETTEALCLAIANARKKAQAMARVCGGMLGAALSMSAEAGGGASALPMGEIEITAAVTMQFSLLSISP